MNMKFRDMKFREMKLRDLKFKQLVHWHFSSRLQKKTSQQYSVAMIKLEEELFLYSKPLEAVHPIPEPSFTTMPCRIHMQDEIAVAAAERLNKEWNKMVGDGRGSTLSRQYSSVGTFAALTWPDCLPERFEITAYILEMAFLHDDIVDEKNHDDAVEETNLLSNAIDLSSNAPQRSQRGLAIKKLLSKTLLELVETYGEEGQILVKKCQGWLNEMTLPMAKKATAFKEFVSQRVLMSGMEAWWAMIEFSLGIQLSQEECNLIGPLKDIAGRIVAQTNDYYSWDVERIYQKDRIFNSIQFLMMEHGLTEDQAKERLKLAILKDECTYYSMLNEFYKTYPNLPIHLRKFVAAGPLLVGGKHHWSAVCPRYKVTGNQNQVCGRNVKEEKGEIRAISPNPNTGNTHCQSALSPAGNGVLILHNDGKADLDDSALLRPVQYIKSLPSKNVRSKLIDAFNDWFQVSDDQLTIIKDVIADLHNASLILDDIQDESLLRRGSTTTHYIFGNAQAINSATYMFVQVSRKVHKLQHPDLMTTLLDGLMDLFIGQSWDLDWKYNMSCPSVAEYMAMVDGKTGAMFKMLIHLLHSISSKPWPISSFDRLGELMGRWFQVRDDYKNLEDPVYSEQKGFCEDFDEGKLSYPVILCCNRDSTARAIILGIFRQRRIGTPLAHNTKIQILNLVRNSGALEEIWQHLQKLAREVKEEVSALEAITGEANSSLHLIVKLLGDTPPPRRQTDQ